MIDDNTFWSDRYAKAEGFLFGEAPSVFLTAQAHHLPGNGTVLAIADGEGRNGVWLAEQGHDVHAIDGSSVALDKSRGFAKRRGVSLRHEHVDLKHWDWPEASYDGIVAIFIQFADPGFRAEIFANMQRAVKPGGVILLHGYRPEQIAYGTGGPPNADNMYDEALLRDAFSDFEIDRLKGYDAEISEGAGHSGMSALIDLVARRPG